MLVKPDLLVAKKVPVLVTAPIVLAGVLRPFVVVVVAKVPLFVSDPLRVAPLTMTFPVAPTVMLAFEVPEKLNAFFRHFPSRSGCRRWGRWCPHN